MSKTASGLTRQQLTTLAQGRAALARAATANDTDGLITVADAADRMARIQGRFEDNRPEVIRWARLASDAAREGGMILRDYRARGLIGGNEGRRTGSARNAFTYADLGFRNRTRPKRWEQLAAVPDADYEAHWRRVEKSTEMRPVWAPLVKLNGADPDAPRNASDVDGFVLGDFRDVADQLPDNSVDLIFTDPPYDRASLPLYADLARVASRVLVDGGSLVTFFGQYQLPEVLDHLGSSDLRYWWQIAVVHQGDVLARMREYGVIVHWKPLLWFVKGSRAGKQGFIEDVVFSQPAKESHRWQQGILEANYCIEGLTPPDGFIFDPFCGGGTTAIAASDLGRRFLTCDVDEDALQVAKARFVG